MIVGAATAASVLNHAHAAVSPRPKRQSRRGSTAALRTPALRDHSGVPVGAPARRCRRATAGRAAGSRRAPARSRSPGGRSARERRGRDRPRTGAALGQGRRFRISDVSIASHPLCSQIPIVLSCHQHTYWYHMSSVDRYRKWIRLQDRQPRIGRFHATEDPPDGTGSNATRRRTDVRGRASLPTGARDAGGSPANAVSRKDVEGSRSSAWASGSRWTIPTRPASESATRGSVIRSADPVSRNRPGRGSASTAVLIAGTSVVPLYRAAFEWYAIKPWPLT